MFTVSERKMSLLNLLVETKNSHLKLFYLKKKKKKKKKRKQRRQNNPTDDPCVIRDGFNRQI